MPDAKKEPELYKIISEHQMHYETHSPTCIRTYSIKGKVKRCGFMGIQETVQKGKKCRFDFPRPVCATAIVNKRAEDLQALPGTRKKMYYLARRVSY